MVKTNVKWVIQRVGSIVKQCHTMGKDGRRSWYSREIGINDAKKKRNGGRGAGRGKGRDGSSMGWGEWGNIGI